MMPVFKIDTATVAAINAMVEVMLVLILLHAWRTRTTYPGFLCWVLGSASWLVGLGLMVLWGEPERLFIPKILGVAAVLLDPILLYEGVRRFYGRPSRWHGLPLNLALMAGVLANQLYFAYLHRNPFGGWYLVDLVIAILFCRVAVEPLLDPVGRRYSIQWLMSAVLVPLIGLLVARGYWTPNLPTDDAILGLAFFYGLVVQMVVAYCYLSLTSQRVEEELGESERKYRELSSSLQLKVEDEIRLRLSQERLLANQARFAAMGKMIGAIAHQWRQPLTTLGIIVQRAHAQGTMRGLTDQDLKEFKSAAMRQIGHMSDTIEQFRGFYRPEKKKEPFSPFRCIADSVTLFEHQFAGNGIAVQVAAEGAERTQVNGFANEFKQVMLNLLSNARDAILQKRQATGAPEEGVIEVQVRSGDPETMSIEISDNGCGITAQSALMIFDPYFTTKEESGGTGIGLYVSRMIIEDSLGGRLLLAAREGGATFRIELPIKEMR